MSARRRFIQQGAALAAIPFISTRVTRALAAAAKPKLGFALCGLGELSANQIAPALLKTKRCRLAGVITDTPAKAAQWQAKYAISAHSVYTYDTMARLADNPDIDVVYVVTPNALHLPHATAAAKAGKHVFCEKPLEITVARCQQLIDAVKMAGRRLGVAYRCRFEPHHLECMRLARERTFGPLRVIDAFFGFNVAPSGWRLKRELAGGGPLMDVGIYALQASRYLTGEEPISVSGLITSGDPERFTQVEASVLWEARFPGGAVSQCGASFASGSAGYVRAIAENGWFALDPAFNYSGIKGQRSDGQPLHFADIDQFAAEMDDFARCIQEDSPSIISGEEGLRDVRVMMAIYQAAHTGARVSLMPA